MIRIREAIIVEGRYDKNTLAQVVDAQGGYEFIVDNLIVGATDYYMLGGSFDDVGFRALNDTLRAEFETVDPGVTVEAVPCELPKEECLRSSVGNLVTLLDLLPSGTQSYLDADRTLVKSSVNFGTLRDEADCFVLRPFFRSNTEYQLDQLARRIETLCRSFSCECRFFNRSPAWQFDPHSSLNAKVQDIWEKTRGYRPPLAIVHGGVEPGLFIEKMAHRGRKLEAVNIGVRNYDVHSTRERMEIATLGQAFELLAALLRDLD